jgi:hypothetical protein
VAAAAAAPATSAAPSHLLYTLPHSLLPQPCGSAQQLSLGKIALFKTRSRHLTPCRPCLSHFPIASPADLSSSSTAASCRRHRSFARKLSARSCSSNPTLTSGFLHITVGSKRCRRSAPLSRNVLRVGECAACSRVWRSRASDWPLRLPIRTWPTHRAG